MHAAAASCFILAGPSPAEDTTYSWMDAIKYWELA